MSVRPFSNGTEYQDWQDANCSGCRKSVDAIGEPGDWPTCEIESALTYAYLGDGTVDQAMADRMGFRVERTWRCAELDAGPPPPVDGKMLVDMAEADHGLVYNPWMCLLDSVAAVRQPMPELWEPRRSPTGVLAQVMAAGYLELEPLRICRPVKRHYKDMVVFCTVTGAEAALDLAWWCQIYEAGMDVAKSKAEPGVLAVLKDGQVVGAVMGLQHIGSQGRYEVTWEA